MSVYRMPQGDWGAACDWCHLITDGFYTDAAARLWLKTHFCTAGGCDDEL